jgi:hypothetical protein
MKASSSPRIISLKAACDGEYLLPTQIMLITNVTWNFTTELPWLKKTEK